MPTRLVFPAKQQVRIEAFDPAPVGPEDVRIRVICSLMSTGTENIVFNRLFDPGTHWDNWVKYPFYPGYSTVGVVEEVGANVSKFKVGDRVVTRLGHASHHVGPAKVFEPAPASIDPRQASWFALGKIAAMGARAARYELGDEVLIIGAGPVGQMATRWAAAAGCGSVIVLDPVESRLPLARRGGATATLALPADQAADAIAKANGGRMPRVVMDSTGHAKVFATALGLAPLRGMVMLMGDTGTPQLQHLTADVIRKGLIITGAHDVHDTEEWNAPKIYRLFFQLVAAGRFDLSDLISHTFAPEQCVEAYKLANERRGETMGILFDWSR